MLNLETITADLDSKLLDGRRIAPQFVNRASSCGSPCERELYYQRADWDKRAPMSMEGLKRVRAGRRYEEWAKQDLMEAGYIWSEAQKTGFDDTLMLSAHIEGYVTSVRDPDGTLHLAEIKSITTLLFNKFHSQADLMEHHFYRRYVYQIVAYMKMMNKDEAIMFLVNRDNGEIRPIHIVYDAQIWADIKEKCEIVNGQVEILVPPQKIDGRGRKETCRFCDFKTHCMPDILNPTRIELKDDPDFLEELREWDSINGQRKRWETLDEIIKEKCREKDMVVVGEFLIEGKKTKRGWRRSITKLKGIGK